MSDTDIDPNQDLLTPREAAKLLRMAPATLAIWRCKRRYPLNYIKAGKKVLYRRADVIKFLEERLVMGSISPRNKR